MGEKHAFKGPEWSYMVDEDKAGTEIQDVKISPSAAEKQALCERLGLLSLETLEAELHLSRTAGNMVVEVAGVLKAELSQPCVVTLDPVHSVIEDRFDAWFADADKAVSLAKARREKRSKKGGGEMPMMEEHDDPEPIVNGQIDLGELVTQYLSLSLNPYPHAEGAVPDGDERAILQETAPERRNPFAALKDWKAKQNRPKGK